MRRAHQTYCPRGYFTVSAGEAPTTAAADTDRVVAYLLVRLTIEALLLAGALTRAPVIAGGLVMIVLVLDAASIEHFSASAISSWTGCSRPAVHPRLTGRAMRPRSSDFVKCTGTMFAERPATATGKSHTK